jgi:hypothetical protein
MCNNLFKRFDLNSKIKKELKKSAAREMKMKKKNKKKPFNSIRCDFFTAAICSPFSLTSNNIIAKISLFISFLINKKIKIQMNEWLTKSITRWISNTRLKFDSYILLDN